MTKNKYITEPESIEAIKSLDGKIFAMLTPEEESMFNFYRDQGRKFGVSASIISESDPDEMVRAGSKNQADSILKRSNSRIRVVTRDELKDTTVSSHMKIVYVPILWIVCFFLGALAFGVGIATQHQQTTHITAGFVGIGLILMFAALFNVKQK